MNEVTNIQDINMFEDKIMFKTKIQVMYYLNYFLNNVKNNQNPTQDTSR